MNSDPQQFDDPELRRLLSPLGRESAPKSLADKVQRLFTEARAPAGGRRVISTARFAMAAAIVMLLLGLGVYFYFHSFRDSDEIVPEMVLGQMVKTHEFCTHQPSHHGVFPELETNFDQLGSAMGNYLKHPVMSADLRGQGWEFKGAAYCKVGDQRAAHLLYSNGTQTLSLFTFKPAQLNSPDGSSYIETIDNHPMACFVYQGTLCGIVQSPGGPDQVKGLMGQCKKHIQQPAPTASPQNAFLIDEE